jgi:hypothetical protein
MITTGLTVDEALAELKRIEDEMIEFAKDELDALEPGEAEMIVRTEVQRKRKELNLPRKLATAERAQEHWWQRY